MLDFSVHSGPRRRSVARRSARPLVIASVALTAMTALAACSKAATPGAQSLSPRQAILLAQGQSQKISALSMSLSEQVNGLNLVNGSIQLRYKPSLALSENLSITESGQNMSLGAVLTGQAVYLKFSELSHLTGKPWVKLPLSALSSKTGINFGALLKTAETESPFEQTSVFAGSTNVHRVGSAVINGVPTTEYTGSVSASTALSKLPAKLRSALGPALRVMGSTVIRYTIWLDANHLTRKLVEHETVAGQAIAITIVVNSVNQAVTIAIPPASQTATMPGLGGSSGL